MSDKRNSAAPDSLMDHFKGQGFKSVVIFTVVVHVVVIMGSSLPFLVKQVAGSGKKASEEERVKSAVADATSAIRKIAKKYDLNPQEISDQFSGKARPAPPPETESEGDETLEAAPADGDADGTEREKSEYEKDLEKAEEGPKVPTFETNNDDLW